ncbi:hypothetical protein NIES267_73330 (plasmid) [Calothrix parasitica NIES-267]|uniref:Uncharacterized protein n=1 Tax=Calothrix parasitica NIES-267 TaxID=1973488 RepID=A0A1Z4M2V1_9CYAN|nr:hypothetical protein NIES267_73330 [Calothrix parasitica NIES-267]
MKIFPLLLAGTIGISTSASTALIQKASANTQPQYEAWIVSVNPTRGSRCLPIHPISILGKSVECGHSFIATVKNTGEGWKVEETFGFWNDNENGSLKVGNTFDKTTTQQILDGQSPAWTGFAVRKARISPSRFEWLKKEAFRTQCFGYPTNLSEPATSIYFCFCTQYATRLWSKITSNWEKYKSIFPEDLTSEIKATTANKGTDFLDDGKVWK